VFSSFAAFRIAQKYVHHAQFFVKSAIPTVAGPMQEKQRRTPEGDFHLPLSVYAHALV